MGKAFDDAAQTGFGDRVPRIGAGEGSSMAGVTATIASSCAEGLAETPIGMIAISVGKGGWMSLVSEALVGVSIVGGGGGGAAAATGASIRAWAMAGATGASGTG